ELLQRLVDFLSALASRSCRLTGLVLIFLGIQLEIEQAGEVPARSASSTTASAPSGPKRHLNFAESGLGAQKVLQRFLLIGQGIGPLLLLQFIGGRGHSRSRRTHIFFKIAKFLILIAQLAAL